MNNLHKLALLLEWVLTWPLYWLPPEEDEPWGGKIIKKKEKKQRNRLFFSNNRTISKQNVLKDSSLYIPILILICLSLKSTQNIKSSLPYFVNTAQIYCPSGWMPPEPFQKGNTCCFTLKDLTEGQAASFVLFKISTLENDVSTKSF